MQMSTALDSTPRCDSLSPRILGYTTAPQRLRDGHAGATVIGDNFVRLLPLFPLLSRSFLLTPFSFALFFFFSQKSYFLPITISVFFLGTSLLFLCLFVVYFIFFLCPYFFFGAAHFSLPYPFLQFYSYYLFVFLSFLLFLISFVLLYLSFSTGYSLFREQIIDI